MILGVDPGKSGGIALMILRSIRTGAPELVWAEPMPALEDLARELSQRASDIKCAYLEKVASRPMQGVTSVFSFGQHYGSLLGVLTTLKIPYVLVPPQAWMKQMHQGTDAGDTKVRSLQAARRLFPGQNWKATPRCKKDHDGIAESALIALYGVKHFLGKIG